MTTRNFIFTILITIGLFSGCASHQPISDSIAKSYSRSPSTTEQSSALLTDDDVKSIYPLIDSQNKMQVNSQNADNIIGIYDNSMAAPVANFIRRATKSIEIEIYEINDLEVRTAIREALSKQVKIRIVKDPTPVGKSCRLWGDPQSNEGADCKDLRKLKSEIESANGQFVAFNKKELCGKEIKTKNCFQHGKIIIIDRELQTRAALVSTGNFNSSNLCDIKSQPKNCNRDFTYITRDREVIATLSKVFEADLLGKRYDLEAITVANNVPKKLTISPYSYNSLINFINSATTRVQIQTQYLKDDNFIENLIELKKRLPKMKIEIQLADTCNYGSISDKDALSYTKAFNAFDDIGIEVQMFNKKHLLQGIPGYMHAKVIIVDNKKAWIGSVNISDSSFNHNREFGIYLANKERVAAFSDFLNDDFRDPSNNEWKKSVLECRRKISRSSNAKKDSSTTNNPNETENAENE